MVLVREWAVNGLPNKRLRLSKETRNIVSDLKAKISQTQIAALNMSECVKEI